MVAEENKPTIKPITIKPIKITPIKPATGANPAPSISINPNPQQATADSSIGSPTIRLKPPTGVSIPTPGTPAPTPAPATTPEAVKPAAPSTAATPKPIKINIGGTQAAPSPINLKAPAQAPITSKAPTTSMPKVVSNTDDDAGKATMRIRPPAAPATPAAPAIKLNPITPPADDVAIQAAKGKTSRISLDSAMDNTAATGNSPAPVGKLTSHIPDISSSAPKSATVKINVPAEEVNTQQVTRKRTLRVKAPARPIPQPNAAANAPDSEAKTVVRKSFSVKKPETPSAPISVSNPTNTDEKGGIDHIPGIEDERIMAFNNNKVVTNQKVNPLFIVFSVLSIIGILLVIYKEYQIFDM